MDRAELAILFTYQRAEVEVGSGNFPGATCLLSVL